MCFTGGGVATPTAAEAHYPPTVRVLQLLPRTAPYRAVNSSVRSVHTPKPAFTTFICAFDRF